MNWIPRATSKKAEKKNNQEHRNVELGNLHCSAAPHLLCYLELAAAEMPSSWWTTSRGSAGEATRGRVTRRSRALGRAARGSTIPPSSPKTLWQSPTTAASHRSSPDWEPRSCPCRAAGSLVASKMGPAHRHAPPATSAGSDRAVGHPVSCSVTTTTIASHPQVARSGTCIRNHTPLRVKNGKKIEPLLQAWEGRRRCRECVAWNHILNMTMTLLLSALLRHHDFNMSMPWVELVLRRLADLERHRRSPLDAGPAASRQSRGCGRLRVLQFRADHMCQCRRPQP